MDSGGEIDNEEGIGNHERKWTVEATARMLDLLEDRKRRLLSDESTELDSVFRLKYEEWRVIAKKLQAESYLYTATSCQKKYSNIKRSYVNAKKFVEREKERHAKTKGGGSKPIKVFWPFFTRFAAYIEEEVDQCVVIEEIEAEGPGDSHIQSGKKHKVGSNYKAEVSNAIHTLLQSEPIIILEDCVVAKENFTMAVVPDDAVRKNKVLASQDEVKVETELVDDESVSHKESLLRRLKRRFDDMLADSTQDEDQITGETQENSAALPSSPEPEAKKKMFSLSTSTTSKEAVSEIKRLRGEVCKINRTLEGLAKSHKRLSDNFDKFFKIMSENFK